MDRFTDTALTAFMDLVLTMAHVMRNNLDSKVQRDRIAAAEREVAVWRETLHLLGTEANRQALEASIRQAHQGIGEYPQTQCGSDMQTYLEMKAAADGRLGIQGASGAATWQARAGAVSQDGQAARTAVAATERRYAGWRLVQQIEGLGDALAGAPIEADDSRVTDGHKCCGGKPDCGCARSVGG